MKVLPREERTASGVMMMALAVAFFSGIDVTAKWLTLAGLPVIQIVFIRYLVHFALGLAIYFPLEGKDVFHSHAPARQILRSFFLFGGTIFNFTALKHLPITVTTAINFAQPIVITLLAIPILGERVGIRRVLAVCAGFFGVLIVVQPWGAEFDWALFYSLTTLLIASLYFIMTRMLACVESNSTQQIWSSGLAVAALMPFAIPIWIWPDAPLEWTILLLIGAFGFFGHSATAIAHRWADASILAPMIYSQAIWAVLAGIFIFQSWPSIWTYIGSIVIACSGLYIWRRESGKEIKSANV